MHPQRHIILEAHNILEAVDVDFSVKKPTITGGKKATYTTIKSSVKDKAKKALEETTRMHRILDKIHEIYRRNHHV